MAIVNDSISRRYLPYNKIKSFLVEHNISQKEVGLLIQKSPSAVNQKLNGTGGDFSLEEARLMTNHFGIPQAYFFEIIIPKKEHKVGD